MLGDAKFKVTVDAKAETPVTIDPRNSGERDDYGFSDFEQYLMLKIDIEKGYHWMWNSNWDIPSFEEFVTVIQPKAAEKRTKVLGGFLSWPDTMFFGDEQTSTLVEIYLSYMHLGWNMFKW